MKSFPNPGAQNALHFRKKSTKTFTKCFFAHDWLFPYEGLLNGSKLVFRKDKNQRDVFAKCGIRSPGIQIRIWDPDKKIANAGSRSVYKEYCINTTCRYA
jgi:hypothetical protein